MSLKAMRITPALGAIVEGIQLSEQLSAEQLDFVKAELIKYQILFFRNQDICRSGELCIGRRLLGMSRIEFSG